MSCPVKTLACASDGGKGHVLKRSKLKNSFEVFVIYLSTVVVESRSKLTSYNTVAWMLMHQ